ncbi:MAG: carbamoyltransferase HypF [Gemmiger sp.]|nr:carbamoyltransferase HypF [Gemmiger sp.]
MKERISLQVAGVVQGVGFRPFLHRLATRHQLEGWVRNTAQGVELALVGEPPALAAFVNTLKTAPPPLAVVVGVTVSPLPAPAPGQPDDLAGHGFVIRPSLPGVRRTLISPDIATCPDCLRELGDPQNRRYRYPFINCTNCGPRFTITKTVPYDRAGTTMAKFALCPTCGAEYRDIANRRYHAQPNCCPNCGPTLALLDGGGTPLPGRPLAGAQQTLRQGGIVAVKGLGGFHLVCRMDIPGPAARLRARKHRDEKPLALLCPSVAAARRLCHLNAEDAALLESPRRPILLCQKQNPTAYTYLSESNTLGLMLPYTPLHTLLFVPDGEVGEIGENAGRAEAGGNAEVGGNAEASEAPESPQSQNCAGARGGAAPLFPALVCTSANLADCPVVTDNARAVAELAGIADAFLLHDREIYTRCDDSLIQPTPEGPVFFRRSRGYAPQPLFTDFSVDGLLALGAEQKASFALGRGRAAFYSQHIGDLKNAETLAHYTAQLARYEELFEVKPRLLLCDAHPDYLSADYARRRAKAEALPLLPVQHHWAHMAACMADNHLPADGTEVVGIIWDGTGLGTDNTVWGGEFLVGNYTGFARAAALRPLPLPGGDAATRRIGRVALALAWDAGQPGAAPLPEAEKAPLLAMLNAGLNCPPSSGVGRLFDGVYALLTGRQRAGYEGQGAVLLQALAERAAARHPGQPPPPYPFCFYRENAAGTHANSPQNPKAENTEMAEIAQASGQAESQAGGESGKETETEAGLLRADTRPLVAALLAARDAGVPVEEIALRFHHTLAALAGETCERLRQARPTLPNKVVLSGGVFQNQLLVGLVAARLCRAGFVVYTHHQVAPNDEGIALGQLAIGAAAGGGR